MRFWEKSGDFFGDKYNTFVGEIQNKNSPKWQFYSKFLPTNSKILPKNSQVLPKFSKFLPTFLVLF